MYNPDLGGILESVLGNSLCVGSGADLEGLDDAGNGLVWHGGVLTLGVLANDNDVNVTVASGDWVEGLGVDNVGIKV